MTSWKKIMERNEKRKLKARVLAEEEARLKSRTPEQVEREERRSRINRENALKSVATRQRIAEARKRDEEQLTIREINRRQDRRHIIQLQVKAAEKDTDRAIAGLQFEDMLEARALGHNGDRRIGERRIEEETDEPEPTLEELVAKLKAEDDFVPE